jgi:hypothetical protein
VPTLLPVCYMVSPEYRLEIVIKRASRWLAIEWAVSSGRCATVQRDEL